MDEAVKLLRDGREAERLRRAELIVKKVKTLDIASFPVGSWVAFSKSFGGDHAYSYLALKVNNSAGVDGWYVTGRTGSLTDEEFEEFLADNGGFDTFGEVN